MGIREHFEMPFAKAENNFTGVRQPALVLQAKKMKNLLKYIKGAKG